MIIYIIVQLYGLDSVQIVQLLPVYCPCGLVICVLRLPVCGYAYLLSRCQKRYNCILCACWYIVVYVCNNAVADCSQLPGVDPGVCVLCWCTWGLAEAVAGVRGVIVPGCGSDPVYNRFITGL